VGDMLFAQGLKRNAESVPYDLSPYRSALVLPLGDRTLDDVWRHERIGQQKMNVKKVLREVGEVLKEINHRNVMHGDLYPENLLRIGADFNLTSVSSSKQIPTDHVAGTNNYTSLIHTSLLPPEMFAKLHSDFAVLKYRKYFQSVQEDAMVYDNASTLSEEEVINLGHKVNEYLADRYHQGNFFDAWDRIKKNAELWKVVRPRVSREGGCTSVIKSFHINPKTNLPYQSIALPYQIQSASASFDIWAYGLLIYQLFAGTTLFKTDRNLNLTKDVDYVRLCNWNQESLDGAFMEPKIGDPLVRDLLRKILVQKELRLESFADILNHPYFDEDGSEEAQELREQILQYEHDVKYEKELTLREKDNYEAWVKNKTIKLDMHSMESILKLSRSTSSQWKEMCSLQANEVLFFPTCFIILPYELDRNGLATDKDVAKDVSLKLAEALHATSIYTEMSTANHSREVTDVLKRKVKEYLDSNNGVVDSRPLQNESVDVAAITSICEWILQRSKNAEQFLDEILGYYLPTDGTLLSASTNAKKIVAGIIPNYVTLEDCTVMLRRALEAERAFSILAKVCSDNLSSVKQAFYEESFSQTDTEKIMRLIADKSEIDNKLLDTINAFALDGIGEARKVLSERVFDLMMYYEEGGYMYLVDEYTGLPIQDKERGFFGHVTELRSFLPAMRLSVKAATCSGDILDGMKRIAGLCDDDLDRDWEEAISFCTVANWQPGADKDEYDVLYDAINGGNPIIKPYEYLDMLEKFVIDQDVAKHYSGLKCLMSPDEHLTMWGMESSKNSIDLCGAKSLKEYAQRVETEACITIQKQLKQKRELQAKLRLKSTWNSNDVTHSIHTVPSNDTQEEFDNLCLAGSSSYDLSVDTEVVHPESNSKSVFHPAFNAKLDQPIHVENQDACALEETHPDKRITSRRYQGRTLQKRQEENDSRLMNARLDPAPPAPKATAPCWRARLRERKEKQEKLSQEEGDQDEEAVSVISISTIGTNEFHTAEGKNTFRSPHSLKTNRTPNSIHAPVCSNLPASTRNRDRNLRFANNQDSPARARNFSRFKTP